MKIRCYGCGRTLDVPDDIVEGQHVKCMHCGTKFAYSLRSACAISLSHAASMSGGESKDEATNASVMTYPGLSLTCI